MKLLKMMKGIKMNNCR